MEEGLLIQISLIAVALAFLETAVVECMEFLEHRSFQILKVTKNLVPEPGDDRCRNLTDGSLYRCFLPGLTIEMDCSIYALIRQDKFRNIYQSSEETICYNDHGRDTYGADAHQARYRLYRSALEGQS